jgi:DNA mismatch endonuclease (patch repair protein)
LKKRSLSLEARKKLSESAKGRVMSEETKMKISIAMRKKDLKTKFAKGNKMWLGRHHTPESKRKLSERFKGKKLPEWHRAKIAAGHIGQVPWDKGLTKATSASLARSGEASRLRWTPERRKWLSNRNRQFFKNWWKQHPEEKERLARINRPTRIELLAKASLERRGIPFVANGSVERICFPDFVLQKRKVAIFCNGCYWHGCAQHCPNIPSWLRLRIRDKEIYEKLRGAGWRVLAIWEHEFKGNPDIVGQRLDEITLPG